MHLKLYGCLVMLLSVASTTQAVMALPPPPVNVEITGQVLQANKPVAGASIKAYFYKCDSKLQASTTSNANGYYRLVIPNYPKVVYFSRPLPPAELLKFQQQFPHTRPRNIRGYRPIPIFLSTQAPTTSNMKVCLEALKGGHETALKNRVNLKLNGIPAKTPTAPTPPKTPTPPTEQQKCQAQGGKWEFISRGVQGCNLSYQDAGRLCTDGKQCSSQVCLAKDRNPRANEGFCAANTSAIINGCMGEIKRGHWKSRACP